MSLNDLVLRQNNSEVGEKPASAKVISSKLQKRREATRDQRVSVGGRRLRLAGRDPATGTRAGRHASRWASARASEEAVASGLTDKDRAAMKTELSEKGLPEGAASAPVSGYIYFPVARKRTNVDLEYSERRKVQLRLAVAPCDIGNYPRLLLVERSGSG